MAFFCTFAGTYLGKCTNSHESCVFSQRRSAMSGRAETEEPGGTPPARPHGRLSAMPIYEYRCESCAERFEELVRRPEDTVACPQCGGTEAERLLSVFAGIGASSGTSAAPDYSRMSPPRGAGGCCGGACGHMH